MDARRDPNEIVRGTNDDALASRASAVAAGYIADPFIKAFVRRMPTAASSNTNTTTSSGASMRSPIINRGTFVRCAAIDSLVARFSAACTHLQLSNPQIISLGAGSDSRFFNLKAANANPSLYVEIDFPEITAKKAQAILRNKDTARLIQNHKIVGGGTELISSDYWLISGDLREFASKILPRLLDMGLSPSRPTLVLSECVLVYIDPPSSADAIIHTIAQTFTIAMFITYEPILPHDAFGTRMLSNLRARGIGMPGLLQWPTLEKQQSRYLDRGWSVARAVDLLTVWNRFISPDEKYRISKLEIFDEVEEYQMILQHYCISWAAVCNNALPQLPGTDNATMSHDEMIRLLLLGWFDETV